MPDKSGRISVRLPNVALSQGFTVFSRKASPSRAGIQATSPIGLGVRWIP